MPEGHALHRVARDQQELIGQRVRATSPQGKFVDGAHAIDQATIESIEAVGKHLLQRFANGATVHVHLGMQGKTFRRQPVAGDPLEQTRLRLHDEGNDLAWDLVAPSTCELLDDEHVAALRDSLGPDPLDPHVDVERALDNVRRAATTPIGAALLDQRTMAGVGNVFRAEALVRTGIHPRAAARDLSDEQLRNLWLTLQALMKQAVNDNEIRPKLVYKQDTCQHCDTNTPVTTETIGGRTAYVCATCQPAA